MSSNRSSRPRAGGPVIVKLGGAQALGPHLSAWVAALAALRGRAVVVPGGGPFADAVRAAELVIGFDARAAHEMALLAMAQFGWALQSLDPAFELCDSRRAIGAALAKHRTPLWAPSRMARRAGLPATWDLTSDSLAAWLAGALRAPTLALVKNGVFASRERAQALVGRGIVDPLFPHYLPSRVRAVIVPPEDAGRLADGLRDGAFPEIVAGDEQA